jgi:beta-galactosidase
LRHLNVQNDNFKHDDIAGAIGWCMFDYNTHKDFGSGDRVCYHGALDMFRIPKFAASVYAMQREKPYMEVLGNLNIGEQEASEVKEVMVMTNADYVKFYINDDFINDFYPSKNHWPYLPKSPIIVDDFIGNLIHENEPYSKKDCDTIKEVLLSVMKTGINIPLRLKIKMLIFLKKNKLSFDQAAVFYEKYIGKWGLESVSYKFQAMKDGEVMMEKVVGSTDKHRLLIEQDDQVLTETDTYQTTRIVVKHVNENNNLMTYSQEVIHIDIDGPLELIGPKSLPLTGGSTGFFVKTKQTKCTAIIKISSNNLEIKEIKVEVK